MPSPGEEPASCCLEFVYSTSCLSQSYAAPRATMMHWPALTQDGWLLLQAHVSPRTGVCACVCVCAQEDNQMIKLQA